MPDDAEPSLMQPSMTCLSCQLELAAWFVHEIVYTYQCKLHCILAHKNFIVIKPLQENGKEMLGNNMSS